MVLHAVKGDKVHVADPGFGRIVYRREEFLQGWLGGRQAEEDAGLLLRQLMLFFSQTTVDVLRSWILLHVGSRINIAIISDFPAQ